MALDEQRVAKHCAHMWTIAGYSYEERYEDRWVIWRCENCPAERKITSPALAGKPPS